MSSSFQGGSWSSANYKYEIGGGSMRRHGYSHGGDGEEFKSKYTSPGGVIQEESYQEGGN